MTVKVLNTGDGENVVETEKQDGVDTLIPSQKNDAESTKKTKQPITPEEAGQFLLTALKYCKEARLTVNGYNEDNKLYLEISGLAYSNGSIFPVTQSHSKVTQSSHTVTQ